MEISIFCHNCNKEVEVVCEACSHDEILYDYECPECDKELDKNVLDDLAYGGSIDYFVGRAEYLID